jgi:CHAT domain-containing protein
MKEDSQVEQTAIECLKPAKVKRIDTRKNLIDLVLKTSDFDLFHYFGHSGRGEESGPSAGRYLSLAKDSRTYRLSDLGELEAERKFFQSAPLVVLNCCDGTDISDLFDGIDGFPHRFIKNASVAFVGALWPVDSRAANRFVSAFYERLSKSTFVVQALHETRASSASACFWLMRSMRTARARATEPPGPFLLNLFRIPRTYLGSARSPIPPLPQKKAPHPQSGLSLFPSLTPIPETRPSEQMVPPHLQEDPDVLRPSTKPPPHQFLWG